MKDPIVAYLQGEIKPEIKNAANKYNIKFISNIEDIINSDVLVLCNDYDVIDYGKPIISVGNFDRNATCFYANDITELQLYKTIKGLHGREKNTKLFKRLLEKEITELQVSNEGTILSGITSALSMKDEYTLKHSNRVAEYTKRFCEVLKEDNHEITMAGLLHDIGKIAVPDNVLKKPDKLTEEEFLEIKKHPQDSAKTVEALFGKKNIYYYVLHHHEKYNGTGYPLKLKNIDIPYGANIIAAVDVFDALTSKRVYRKDKFSIEDANKMILDGKGTHFFPEIAQKFYDNMEYIIQKK